MIWEHLCCCCSVRTGGYLIAGFTFLLILPFIVLYSLILAGVIDTTADLKDKNVRATAFIILTVMIFIAIIAIVLWMGLFYDVVGFLWTYFVVILFAEILAIGWLVYYALTTKQPIENDIPLIILMVVAGIFLYFLIVVLAIIKLDEYYYT